MIKTNSKARARPARNPGTPRPGARSARWTAQCPGQFLTDQRLRCGSKRSLKVICSVKAWCCFCDELDWVTVMELWIKNMLLHTVYYVATYYNFEHLSHLSAITLFLVRHSHALSRHGVVPLFQGLEFRANCTLSHDERLIDLSHLPLPFAITSR